MNMVKSVLLIFGAFLFCRVATASQLRFSIIRTGTAHTREALVMTGGSLFKPATLNHSAILIEHDGQHILFDTGLGRAVDEQFGLDMPFWAKPFFRYTKLQPAVDQIPSHVKAKISRIFLSHVHWDHASALPDFSESCVAIAEDEKFELSHLQRTATFPSQFSHATLKWCNYPWAPVKYKGFAGSHDIFGDQTAVLVPLPGHTHGSVGLFLRVQEQTYFFVGDLSWSRKAIAAAKGKSWPASLLVDRSREQTLLTLLKVKDLMSSDKNLVVIPAHDAESQDQLGYFPKWIE